MEARRARRSGIELLRILTAMGVVLLHYNDGRAFVYAKELPNLYVLYFLESLCICAVDLFILISGYFLSGTQKRNYIKPFQLIFQVILINEALYLLGIMISGAKFSVRRFLFMLVPENYFVIFYTALYIISPYLNRVFNGFTKEQWKRFLIMIIMIFSVWTTFVDLSEEIMGRQWGALSTIAISGSNKGFNIVNFILLYFVGAYLRFNDGFSIVKTRRRQLLAIAITVTLIFGWALAVENLERVELRSSWVYHNTLVIWLAALVFMLFRSFEFSSRIVNELAGGAFTCFLLHGHLLGFMGIEKYSTGNIVIMLCHMAFVMVLCYSISYIVYRIYDFASGWFFKLLSEKICFFQVRKDV